MPAAIKAHAPKVKGRAKRHSSDPPLFMRSWRCVQPATLCWPMKYNPKAHITGIHGAHTNIPNVHNHSRFLSWIARAAATNQAATVTH